MTIAEFLKSFAPKPSVQMASPLTVASTLAGIPRWLARLILLLLALAVFTSPLIVKPQKDNPVDSKFATPNPTDTRAIYAPDGNGDLVLYKTMIERVRRGDSFYASAAELQRFNDYPLKPFVTFRLPTLAYVQAVLPNWLGQRVLFLILFFIGFFLWWKWFKAHLPERWALGAIGLYGMGALLLAMPNLAVLHEAPAGLLMALVLVVWRRDHWGLAVIIGCAAMLMRETLLPMALVLAGLAAWERRWAEVAAWGAGILVLAVVMGLHASHVQAVVLATDKASPGWGAVGGWPHLVDIIRLTSPLRLIPAHPAGAIVALALIGWIACVGERGRRCAAVMVGYACMFMVIGRPNNFYWALMIAPLFLVGLVWAPRALVDLWQAAGGRVFRKKPAGFTPALES